MSDTIIDVCVTPKEILSWPMYLGLDLLLEFKGVKFNRIKNELGVVEYIPIGKSEVFKCSATGNIYFSQVITNEH